MGMSDERRKTMSRWTDKDALIALIRGNMLDLEYAKRLVQVLNDEVLAPSIRLVHCRECRHYHVEKYHTYCGMLNIRGKFPPDPEPDDFCSYGERRTAIFSKHADQIIIDESYAGNRSEIPTGSERSEVMENKAHSIVLEYIRKHLDKTDSAPQIEIYTVWKCKALQNWKFLISSSLLDGMYYELTFNGDKNEWYLDAYKKFENQVIPEL